tara:strand:+ start:499 stop:2232 length:1734 start_codon:yes stop_codon:yes gene_type:complete
MLLKLCIDSSTQECSFFKTDVMEMFNIENIPFLSNFSPGKNKLFNQDIFNYENDTNSIKIYDSSTRNSQHLPGILKIDKTFGKFKNKLLYRCIPDDKRLPHFLIYYNIPANFSKVNTPFYILFSFDNWDYLHPYGIVKQNLGRIDVLPNFYEYILYCKSLQISNSKFNKITNQVLKQQTHQEWINNMVEKNKNIIDRRNNYYIFSIDGSTTNDYDDAIGLKDNVLSIYISNVAIWLDNLDLWDAFSKRVSTIYLPNHKRNMLPNILSDDLCSLIKKKDKIALTMDIYFNETNETINIEKIEYKNCLIRLKENFIYESDSLLNNSHYNKILSIVHKLNKNDLFIHNIRNSYDLISYLMIFMNYKTSIFLKKEKIGIFRKLEHSYDSKKYENIDISDDDKQFIFLYHSNCAQYCKHDDSIYNSFMYNNIKQYTHITSPIRRLVDLLNSITLQKKLNILQFSSNKGISFYENWVNDLEYINLMMRCIRKVQNNCNIFSKIENSENKLVCKGLCFDGIDRNNKMKMYNVFIKELNYVGKISISNEYAEKIKITDFKYYNFEIYLFLNEENMKKKVKLKIHE